MRPRRTAPLSTGEPSAASGHIGSFSFYANKIITTGEGGMLTTDDDELAARCRMLRDHAMPPQKRYWHDEVGFNYRMTNLQAAVGVAQMERIDDVYPPQTPHCRTVCRASVRAAGRAAAGRAAWLRQCLLDVLDPGRTAICARARRVDRRTAQTRHRQPALLPSA